jgi:predicted transcriptional regulator
LNRQKKLVNLRRKFGGGLRDNVLMSRSKKSGHSKNPTLSRAMREEVLEYFQNQGGSVKETAIYIHFVLEHHEEIPDILAEFVEEGLIIHKEDGHFMLTGKGKKALIRLQSLRDR